MSAVRPEASSMKLADFQNQLVAMRYVEDLPVEKWEYQEGTRTKPTTRTVEVTPIRAELVTYGEAGQAIRRGTTKVFPQILANILRNAENHSFVIGKLVKVDHKSDSTRRVWVIQSTDISDDEFSALAAALG